ncbi:MAG TPA: MarR family transcriptional regulator [Tepidisphaeraceae bacterium]|jgi:DNA-binding MarR family transcriptional regulator|nr:MarR family transcriptional regulator [Tepidisphaeraceae bacterium]
MAKLMNEIRKSKPFDCREQEVFLNLMRTAEALAKGMDALLKPVGLSATQYNVLRILRGADARCDQTGLPCHEIGSRMVTRDPDITRLLDRMEKAGLIHRQRDTTDRRIIKTAITDAALRLLKDLDEPVLAMHRKQLSHLGQDKLQQLCELLETAREHAM